MVLEVHEWFRLSGLSPPVFFTPFPGAMPAPFSTRSTHLFASPDPDLAKAYTFNFAEFPYISTLPQSTGQRTPGTDSTGILLLPLPPDQAPEFPQGVNKSPPSPQFCRVFLN